MAQVKQCLQCGRDSVYRSRTRNAFEHLLGFCGCHAFVCLGCTHRFFRFRLRRRQQVPAKDRVPAKMFPELHR